MCRTPSAPKIRAVTDYLFLQFSVEETQGTLCLAIIKKDGIHGPQLQLKTTICTLYVPAWWEGEAYTDILFRAYKFWCFD